MSMMIETLSSVDQIEIFSSIIVVVEYLLNDLYCSSTMTFSNWNEDDEERMFVDRYCSAM